MDASPNTLRRADAAASVREKVGEYQHRGRASADPWARGVMDRLDQETEDVAGFLAFNIQRHVQRQLKNDDLRQLYNAYVTHGYTEVATALARKAEADAVAATDSEVDASAAFAPSAPTPVVVTTNQQQKSINQFTSPRAELNQLSSSPTRAKKARRRGQPSKVEGVQDVPTQVERDKMRAIEAQIRASQLARFAMRSGTRKKLTHSKK
eukprot:g1911.t1